MRVISLLWWIAFALVFAFCFVGVFVLTYLLQVHRVPDAEGYGWILIFLVGLIFLSAAAGFTQGKRSVRGVLNT